MRRVRTTTYAVLITSLAAGTAVASSTSATSLPPLTVKASEALGRGDGSAAARLIRYARASDDPAALARIIYDGGVISVDAGRGEQFSNAVPVAFVDGGVAFSTAQEAFTIAVGIVAGSGVTAEQGIAGGQAIAKTELLYTSATTGVRTSGQVLPTGAELRAYNGVRLRVGGDGNLVVYGTDGKALWDAGTRGRGAFLRLGRDGNAVLRDAGGRVLWQTRTGGQGESILTLQRNGNLVLHRYRDGAPTWSSEDGRLAR